MADSSPRAGREWLFSELWLFISDLTEGFPNTRNQLADMQRQLRHGGFWNKADVSRLTKRMMKASWHIVITPGCLGCKNVSLAHKFGILSHGGRLMARNWELVKWFFASMIRFVTDFGTEAKLAHVPTINSNLLFKTWDERVLEDEDPLQLVDPAHALIGVNESLATPGPEHVLHNLEQQALERCRCYKRFCKAAREVGTMLHGRYWADLISQVCLNKQSLEWLITALYSFNGQIYEALFGSVIGFAQQIRPLRCLQLFFDAAMFDGAASASQDTTDGGTVDFKVLAWAINSSRWWGYGLHIEDSGKISSYVARMGRIHRDMQQRRPCPARGMCMQDLACDAGRNVSAKHISR